MHDHDEGERPATNALGIVGFIFAFCLPPLGLILSLVGLAKAPRGFAIAGAIIGTLTTLALAAVVVVGYVMAPAIVQTTEVVTDFSQIREAIDRYRANNDGDLPRNLADLNLAAGVDTDPWGTQYRYERGKDGAWTLTVAGPDKTFDDGKDAVLTSTMRNNEAGETIGQTFAEELVRGRLSNP